MENLNLFNFISKRQITNFGWSYRFPDGHHAIQNPPQLILEFYSKMICNHLFWEGPRFLTLRFLGLRSAHPYKRAVRYWFIIVMLKCITVRQVPVYTRILTAKWTKTQVPDSFWAHDSGLWAVPEILCGLNYYAYINWDFFGVQSYYFIFLHLRRGFIMPPQGLASV